MGSSPLRSSMTKTKQPPFRSRSLSSLSPVLGAPASAEEMRMPRMTAVFPLPFAEKAISCVSSLVSCHVDLAQVIRGQTVHKYLSSCF